MATTVYDVLDLLPEQVLSEADKGTKFEELIAAYLKVDPTYAR